MNGLPQPPNISLAGSEHLRPVCIGTGNLTEVSYDQLLQRYCTDGFSLVGVESPCEKTLVEVCEQLGLGTPFMPPHYAGTTDLYQTSGVNIKSARGTSNEEASHRAFTTGSAQALHVDGTLQRIGLVKTSVLLCVSPASSGGETLIFNAVEAFLELPRRDREAAPALCNPRRLLRRNLSNIEEAQPSLL